MQNDPYVCEIGDRLFVSRYQQFFHKDGLCDEKSHFPSVPFGDKGTYTHRTATLFRRA